MKLYVYELIDLERDEAHEVIFQITDPKPKILALRVKEVEK